MNTQKRKVQEKNSYRSSSSHQQPRIDKTGLCFQSQLPIKPMNPPGRSDSSSVTISGNFALPTSVFYAPENCMDFSQNIDGLPTFCEVPRDHDTSLISSHHRSYHHGGKDFEDFDLQSVVQFQMHHNQHAGFSAKPDRDSPGSVCLSFKKKLSEEATPNQRQKYVGFSDYLNHHQFLKPSLYHQAADGTCYGMISSASHQQHQSSTLAPAAAAAAAVTSKTRVRWPQDLHNRFVESVDLLGGAERATPKGILKLMDVDGLTIFNVKSHLQKFRTAKHIPEPTEEACGLWKVETLRLQLDVQKRLHEQLQVQRNLQLQVERQGKRLKPMLDHQQKTTKSLISDTHNLDDPPNDLKDVCFWTRKVSRIPLILPICGVNYIPMYKHIVYSITRFVYDSKCEALW